MVSSLRRVEHKCSWPCRVLLRTVQTEFACTSPTVPEAEKQARVSSLRLYSIPTDALADSAFRFQLPKTSSSTTSPRTGTSHHSRNAGQIHRSSRTNPQVRLRPSLLRPKAAPTATLSLREATRRKHSLPSWIPVDLLAQDIVPTAASATRRIIPNSRSQAAALAQPLHVGSLMPRPRTHQRLLMAGNITRIYRRARNEAR
jgi:hypothetical protein